jgi:hypothetical protein
VGVASFGATARGSGEIPVASENNMAAMRIGCVVIGNV